MFDVLLCSFIKILYDIVSGKNYDLCGKNYYMVSIIFLYLLVNETCFFLMNQGCFSFSSEHFFNSDQLFQRKKIILFKFSLAVIGTMFFDISNFIQLFYSGSFVKIGSEFFFIYC